MSRTRRVLRLLVGAICLPILLVTGMVRTTIAGEPDEPDNWLARATAWALAPFRRA